MKKPIIFSVLFFIITATSSFGQGVWIEENVDPDTVLRTGKIEVNGNIYEIKPGANLEGANLQRVDLSGADLLRANLSGANLIRANLEEANLSVANLEGAVLIRANLEGAALMEANLEKADLRGSNLSRADLSSSQMSNANLTNAIMIGTNPDPSLFIHLGGGIQLDNSWVAITLEAREQLTALGQNDTAIGEQLTALGNNDTAIGEQLTALGNNDTAIGEQITKLGENDESIMAEINAMKAQLQTLVASVAEKDAQIAEKDAKIAELEQGGGGQSLEQVLEQVRDARAGSVVLTVDPEGDTVTLGLTIEQSDNLIEWTKLEGEITRTIPIPDGKNFYRFALDKSAQKEVHDPGHLDPPIEPIDPVIIIDPPIDLPIEF